MGLLALMLPMVAPSPAGAAPVTFSYVGPPVPIPDGLGAAIPGPPASVPITVAGLGPVVGDVNFRIDGTSCSAAAGSTTVGIDHTFVNDLDISVTSPSGTTVGVIIAADGSGHNFCQVLLDDDAGAPSIGSAVTANAPFTGTWAPTNPLSAFDGENPNGVWTITVQDFFIADTGSIRFVSLIIDDTPSCTIIVAAPGMTTFGTSGNDVICGSSGDDRIAGLGGNDIIFGNGGNDQISGGEGNDTIFGGPGNDQLAGDEGNDRLFGDAGTDKLSGGPGDDVLDMTDGAGGDQAVGGPHVSGDTCPGDAGDVALQCAP